MKVLVTGSTGFVGRHLVEFLLGQKKISVHGLVNPGKTPKKNLDAFRRRGVAFFECDVRDADSVERILKKTKPARIYHLAGRSSSKDCWKFPEDTFVTNVIGTVNIFEAVKRSGLETKIHVAGSSEQIDPLSPYGISKASQDLLSYQYFKACGLKIVRTCAYNHTGPGQSEDFVVSSFAKQAALIEAGKTDAVMHVGNLGVVRDFTDVRDVVRAYWLSLEKGAPGERYDVASGRGRKIQEIVDFYIRRIGKRVRIRKDPARVRTGDAPVAVGDTSKLRKTTGWSPQISFEKTLSDILDYWRIRVRQMA